MGLVFPTHPPSSSSGDPSRSENSPGGWLSRLFKGTMLFGPLILDSPIAIAAGRQLYGFDKFLGGLSIDYSDPHKVVFSVNDASETLVVKGYAALNDFLPLPSLELSGFRGVTSGTSDGEYPPSEFGFPFLSHAGYPSVFSLCT